MSCQFVLIAKKSLRPIVLEKGNCAYDNMLKIKKINMFIFTGDWELKYKFKAFEGFQSRQGYYTSKSSNEPSDGIVNLIIRDELNDETDPSIEQVNAINYIIENPQIIQNTLINAVHTEYNNLKELYGYINDDEEDFFPKITQPDDYKKVFGIGNVFILTESRDGFAYVGFECGCTWDDEHGLGIFTHKDRVISFGGADEAFSSWEALKDNGTYDQKIKEYQDLNSGIIKMPKPKIYKPQALLHGYVGWHLTVFGIPNLVN